MFIFDSLNEELDLVKFVGFVLSDKIVFIEDMMINENCWMFIFDYVSGLVEYEVLWGVFIIEVLKKVLNNCEMKM